MSAYVVDRFHISAILMFTCTGRPGREQREKLEREKVEVWNANHPAGTLISFEEVIGQGETHRSRTRSDASMMCGQAVVWIEAQSSCVSLDHCTVVRG